MCSSFQTWEENMQIQTQMHFFKLSYCIKEKENTLWPIVYKPASEMARGKWLKFELAWNKSCLAYVADITSIFQK